MSPDTVGAAYIAAFPASQAIWLDNEALGAVFRDFHVMRKANADRGACIRRGAAGRGSYSDDPSDDPVTLTKCKKAD